MLTLQLALSFLIWIASGVFVARRARRSGQSHPSPSAAALLGALLFALSAVVLVAGLFWIAQSSGSVKAGLATTAWLEVTALGTLFTVGQAEAACLVLASVLRRATVTDEAPGPSCTSSSSRPN